MKFVAAAIAAVLALASPAGAASPSATDQAAIMAVETRLPPAVGQPAFRTLAGRMAELKVPGVSIAFIENGKVIWTRAYGVAAAGGEPPVTPATLFQAASMSKALAATAALRLVEQGKLDLDGDINDRLRAWKVPPSASTAEQKVTLRRLLSHTAGMTVSGFPGYQAGKPVPGVVEILDGVPPSNTPAIRSFEAPGGAYAYSGGGYTVAQLAIVEAGGRPYPDLLQALVLRPAGMRQSTFAQPLPAGLVGRSASGHDRKGAVIPGGPQHLSRICRGELWTTPSDYGRFMIALENAYAGGPRALLRQSTARTMMTPVDAGYGLGVVLGQRGGHPYFQHSGGNAGFQCNALAFLDGSRQGAVVMTNGDAGGVLATEIFGTLASAYAWGEPGPASKGSYRRAPLSPPSPK